jgi:export-related chaperone CsaA
VSGTETRIRRAESGDAGAITDIYNEAVLGTTATFDTEPKTEQDRLVWLAKHDERHPVLVAERDGQVVGWAALSKWSERPAYADTGESSCYVAERWRGQGVGRALKERLIEEARRVGLHTILARVAEGSAASLHLNESLGFTLVGTMREVGLKFGRRLDVHLMQLVLEAPAAAEPLRKDEIGPGSTDVKRADQDVGQITWEDFERVELRVGTIVSVEDFPEARKPAYKIKADFGPQIGVRQSSAQITALYTKDDLLGRQIIGVVNFPPKQIGPFMSEFLVTGIYREDGSVVLLIPERTVPNGSKLA